MIGLIVLTVILTIAIVGYVSGVIFYLKQGLGLFSFASWGCWLAMKCWHI